MPKLLENFNMISTYKPNIFKVEAPNSNDDNPTPTPFFGLKVGMYVLLNEYEWHYSRDSKNLQLVR